MLSRRVNIQLDDDRYERISRLAQDGRTSISAVVREVLDRGLPSPVDATSALRTVLDAPAMPVPDDPAELRVRA
jgi:predicted transcriptional regulator